MKTITSINKSIHDNIKIKYPDIQYKENKNGLKYDNIYNIDTQLTVYLYMTNQKHELEYIKSIDVVESMQIEIYFIDGSAGISSYIITPTQIIYKNTNYSTSMKNNIIFPIHSLNTEEEIFNAELYIQSKTNTSLYSPLKLKDIQTKYKNRNIYIKTMISIPDNSTKINKLTILNEITELLIKSL